MADEVIEFPGTTRLRTPVPRVLASAAGAKLQDVVVIGRDEDGNLYLSSSSPDGPDVIWLIELAKRFIFATAEGEEDGA
jgi:hypothetical protein